MNFALPLLVASVVSSTPEGNPLSLADFAEYEAILSRPAEQGKSVGFRDIWDHAAEYQGRTVRIEGDVARRFHQRSVGRLPALTELWIVSASGNPFCLVFPEKEDGPRVGTRVRFNGTFLKWLRYRGGDTERLAPLIIGAQQPSILGPPSGLRSDREYRVAMDWTVGLIGGLIVMGILLMRHLNKPLRRRPRADAVPRFEDEGVAAEGADSFGDRAENATARGAVHNSSEVPPSDGHFRNGAGQE